MTAVSDFPVYVDSPMAVEATEVFTDHALDCYDEEAMELVKKHINPVFSMELSPKSEMYCPKNQEAEQH